MTYRIFMTTYSFIKNFKFCLVSDKTLGFFVLENKYLTQLGQKFYFNFK